MICEIRRIDLDEASPHHFGSFIHIILPLISTIFECIVAHFAIIDFRTGQEIRLGQ